MGKTEDNGLPPGLSELSKSILAASIRNSTRKKYENYVKRWKAYCCENNIQEVSATNVVNFLTMLFENNNSYSAIKTAKSAISHTVCLPPFSSLGDHPLIVKFMKGVFNLRPPKTKTGFIWDVSILFNLFRSIDTNENLSFYDLTCKTLCLLILLNGARINTVFNFQLDEIIINEIGVTITPSNVLKHSKQNRKGDIFTYSAFLDDSKLCIVQTLSAYLEQRNKLVSADIKKLFVTTKRPFKAASANTLRRWVKNTLTKAGIFNFSAHSCRSASTSKAVALNIDLEEVLKLACWKREETFYRHYKKHILTATKDLNKILENN